MEFDQMPNLYLGTSSSSAESFVSPFYPSGTLFADFLAKLVSNALISR